MLILFEQFLFRDIFVLFESFALLECYNSLQAWFRLLKLFDRFRFPKFASQGKAEDSRRCQRIFDTILTNIRVAFWFIYSKQWSPYLPEPWAGRRNCLWIFLIIPAVQQITSFPHCSARDHHSPLPRRTTPQSRTEEREKPFCLIFNQLKPTSKRLSEARNDWVCLEAELGVYDWIRFFRAV